MVTTFRTLDAPPVDRVGRWEQVLDETVLPLRRRHVEGGAGFEARLSTGRIGAVRVTEMVAPAGECVRSTALIRPGDADRYQIDVLCRGEVTVEQDGREVRLDPGDIGFVDPGRPVRYRHSATTHVAVGFPRAMLPLAPSTLTRRTPMRVPGDRGTGALVSSLARQLPRHLGGGPSVERVRLGVALVDLLAAALVAQLPAEPRGSDPAGLLGDVYAYVEEHLGDPDLSPARIAAAQHVSLRRLHKLFEGQDSTVSGWVRQRRLDRCRRDLLDPAQRSKPAHAIAARWGLPNAAHFSRLFKARYGMTPARYRSLTEG